MKKFLSLAIISVLMLLAGCGGNNYKHLSQDEAVKMMTSNPDAIVIDVRSEEEYEKKHIPNVVLVPIDNLRAENFEALPNKDQMILIYCWTGRRSEEAAKILGGHGYKNVYEFGGLVDWTGAAEGTEVE